MSMRPLPTYVNSGNSSSIVDLATEFPTDSATDSTMVCGYRGVTLFRLLDS
jgi:hypothetical protein